MNEVQHGAAVLALATPQLPQEMVSLICTKYIGRFAYKCTSCRQIFSPAKCFSVDVAVALCSKACDDDWNIPPRLTQMKELARIGGIVVDK
jgi:hypothetical protein